MFSVSLRYILILFLLLLFGASFFSSEVFLPYLRIWKSDELFNLSKVYQDESISNETNLLSEGLKKARIANLLDPNNPGKTENFLKLLYRLKPTEALISWSDSFPNRSEFIDNKIELLRKCLKTLRDNKISTSERIISVKIALKHLNFLEKDVNWFRNPETALLSAQILAQIGSIDQAREIIMKSLENHPYNAESVFFLTKITVHSEDRSNLNFVASKLAELSTRKNETGKEAIRYMTLLHLLQPLSYDSLLKCIDLLRTNAHSESIDYMRIYALLYQITDNDIKKRFHIKECSDLFDLKNSKEHFIFCNWLGSIGAHSEILNYLSQGKAKTDENLFQLRMNALANTNDIENIHFEVNNAPTIPSRWRLAIEARAFSLQRNFIEAEKTLNRLISSISSDPRHVRAICDYLEKSNDIKGLSHILEKLTDHPVHQNFAVKKLIQFRSSSASLEQLLLWTEILSKTKNKDESFKNTNLYLQLLDPLLQSPSRKLEELTEHAKNNINFNSASFENKIILALAYLRNQSADKALVALGNARDWRKWSNVRPAWSLIASQIYKLNFDSEKALILAKNLDVKSLSRAEYESMRVLFPNSILNSSKL